MGKKKDAAEKAAKKIAKLEAFIADKSNPKSERKAAKAKLQALVNAVDAQYQRETAAGVLAEAESPDALDAQGVEPPTPEEINAAADAVLADPESSAGARDKAEKAKERAAKLEKAKAAAAGPIDEPQPEPVDDAAVSARIQAKRALRKAGLLTEDKSGAATVDPDAVPRDDKALVDAYNLVIGTVTSHYLTSDDERAAIDARIAPPKPDAAEPAEAADSETAEPDEIDDPAPEPERDAEPPAEPAFAAPSEAPATFSTNGLGQYIVKRPSDGKLVGYTRVTTYIDNLDDKSALTLWKLRIALEGLARNEIEVGTAETTDAVPEHLLATVREAIHRRDHAIAKARKADRKGRLAAGELGPLIEEAWRVFKKAANAVAEQALELGGVADKADLGTRLHELTELYDAKGIDALAALLEAGEITPADFADIEAYGIALDRAGVKVLANEVQVVNHDLKVAGRLDKIVMAKATPDAQRATKMIADVKTGSVEYAPGKIAQQLALYASSEVYDPATHESTRLGASKTVALLIHLPAGQARCSIYRVDLTTGRRGVALSGEVRRWRSESKRLAVDFKTDLAGGEA